MRRAFSKRPALWYNLPEYDRRMEDTACASTREPSFLRPRLPVPQALMRMAIPTIISQLINLVYNMADTWFIGRAPAGAETEARPANAQKAIEKSLAFLYNNENTPYTKSHTEGQGT